MNDSAIDDLLGTSLYVWYSHVSQWMPGSYESIRPCENCHWELRSVIDPEAWPHELVDGLAAAVDAVSGHVAHSMIEEGAEPRSAADMSRGIVLEKLFANRDDIRDVLEQCIPYRLQAYEELEFDLATLGGF